MNDTRKGKFYAILFGIFILILIIGGFILTKNLTSREEIETESDDYTYESDDPDELKIDKEEDYIYFVNNEIYSEELGITYQNVIMNIESSEAQEIASTLNNENAVLKESITLISSVDLEEEEEEKIIYRIKDIYEAKYRTYTRYFSSKYASLVLNDYEFDCFNGSKYLGSKAYVIDITSGHVLTNTEILNMSKLSIEEIKLKIQEKIENKEDIDLTGTLTLLDDSLNYALYINKSGQITISYIVKTTNSSYNDSIVLN